MTLVACAFCGNLIPVDCMENHRYYCQKKAYLAEIRDRLKYSENKRKGKILDAWL